MKLARTFFAALLSLILIATAPGLGSYEAIAQVVGAQAAGGAMGLPVVVPVKVPLGAIPAVEGMQPGLSASQLGAGLSIKTPSVIDAPVLVQSAAAPSGTVVLGQAPGAEVGAPALIRGDVPIKASAQGPMMPIESDAVSPLLASAQEGALPASRIESLDQDVDASIRKVAPNRRGWKISRAFSRLSERITNIVSLPSIADQIAGFRGLFDQAPALAYAGAYGASYPRPTESPARWSISLSRSSGEEGSAPHPVVPSSGGSPSDAKRTPDQDPNGPDHKGGAQSAGLPRTLGRASATLMTAAMIVGTGIFGAIGAATAAAGSGLLVAMIMGGAVALATGISAAQLGVNYPKEGGAFTWAREFNYKTLAFVAGSSYLGKGIMSASVIALAFATYSAQILPGVPRLLLALPSLIGAIAFNSFGLKLTSKVLIGLTAANVALLAVFAIFAAPAVTIAHLTPVFGASIPGLLAGAATFFWTWDGFMRTAIMAGEVKEPRKTIPFAIIGGIAIAALVFLAVGAATLGVLGPAATALDDAPVLRAAKAIGSWLAWPVMAAAWTAALSELLGDLMSASRVALAMGKAGELPGWLGRIHAKFQVPRNAVLAIGAVVTGLVLTFDLRPLLAVASVFTLVWYGITHFLALKLPKEKRFMPTAFSWFGIAGCLALMASLPLWASISGAAILAGLAGLRWTLAKAKDRAPSPDSPEIHGSQGGPTEPSKSSEKSVELDTGKLEQIFGVKPELFPSEGVAKVSFPRTDVKIEVEGRPMEPFMGLTSWASFQKGKKPGIEAMVMGDIVLFEDEVNPAMSAALENGLEATALHNHFFFDNPKVYFMHIGGEGGLEAMANGVKKTLDTVKAIRAAKPAPGTRFDGQPIPTLNSISTGIIEDILGLKAASKDGMCKFVIGRNTMATCGCIVGKAMGVNTWAAFAGENKNALVAGDFAVLEHELQPVLKLLRQAGINIVAIHHHMVQETPKFLFLHYWGKGAIEDLARALKSALDLTKDEKKPEQCACKKAGKVCNCKHPSDKSGCGCKHGAGGAEH